MRFPVSESMRSHILSLHRRLPGSDHLKRSSQSIHQAGATGHGGHTAMPPPLYDACDGDGGDVMASVSVRYIVDDVAAAIAFYCDQLDFHQVMHPAPTFAMLDRGELRLVLSAPSSQGGGGQAMPDGTQPEPGGWNRFVIEVDDIADRVQLLRQRGVHFRNEIVEGVGGKQILLEDPAGNPIELFEPNIPDARLTDA
jgi:catechol 2,3-dioxygenase-like lactoylglutathione lyase family enzyme